MPQTQSQGKAGSLEALAQAHFQRKFTAAERNFLAKATKGEFAVCGPSVLATLFVAGVAGIIRKD